ncbi:MAG: hypothetical protein R2824_12860 [Saprospiraceae bacterium]|nr:hypothetical protein [Lewinella sp.]
MTIRRYINFIAVLSLFCFFACQSGKSSGTSSCKTKGEVQDFSGLDGCSLLIVTEDGKKLLPGKMPDTGVELKAGLKIRFDYRPIDMMSVCMTEDEIVEITCLEVIP